MDPTLMGLTFRTLEEITDGFSEERKLGQGAYLTVCKGEHKNGDETAVKMLHNDTLGFDDKQFENEFQNLMSLEHPNIVRLVAYCYETQHKHVEYKVRGNWTTRLQATRHGSTFEAYRHQVKTCTEIALKYMEIDRYKRPNIFDIIHKINEKETMIGKLINIVTGMCFLNKESRAKCFKRLASRLNLNDIQENQEADQHNCSCFKEKLEDHDVHQIIIPMEQPDYPIDVHPLKPWILTCNVLGSVDILNYDTQVSSLG
uniref:Protein kinase-2 n=1 Tax=Oryza coarctata TaxID=77588 RepID=E0CW93_ORYCO|nr:protein kinase-2 [Oryza coarctata]